MSHLAHKILVLLKPPIYAVEFRTKISDYIFPQNLVRIFAPESGGFCLTVEWFCATSIIWFFANTFLALKNITNLSGVSQNCFENSIELATFGASKAPKAVQLFSRAKISTKLQINIAGAPCYYIKQLKQHYHVEFRTKRKTKSIGLSVASLAL